MSPRTYWRLTPIRDLSRAFAGCPVPTRWAHRASPVYAASSISLAALERLIYTQVSPLTGRHRTLHLYRIRVPETCVLHRVDTQDLPREWTKLRPPTDPTVPATALQRLGDAWYQRGESVGFLVPSAHVPEEPNLLLHPAHPDFDALTIQFYRAFHYDGRIAQSLAGDSKR